MSKKRFTEQDKERLRDTDMEAILKAHGKDTSHTSGFLYFSPFREEKNPSFHIDHKNHRWADHGSCDPLSRKNGQKVSGGDTIDLVMLLRDCTFVEALEYLSDFHPELYIEESEVISTRYSSPSRIVIDRVRDSFSAGLRKYAAQERFISLPVLSRYCRQLDYHIERDGEKSRSYYALGFPSMGGSWEIRNAFFKLSTGKAASVIDRDGNFLSRDSLTPSHDNVIVFEGFMNFLSWLEIRGVETPGDCDVVVLNSVSMMDSAMDFILSHRTVVACLDNDQTGRNYTEYLRCQCQNPQSIEGRCRFVDWSEKYSHVNDLNDLLKTLRQPIPGQQLPSPDTQSIRVR